MAGSTPRIDALETVPTVQRLTSGSSTYNTPSNAKYLRVRLVGGGGGGGGGNGGSGIIIVEEFY